MNPFRSLFCEKCGTNVRKPSRSRLRPAVASLEDRCLAAVDAFIWFDQSSANVAQFDGAKSSKPAFEIKDFSFGVENPMTIGSSTGGAGAGKIKFQEFVIKRITDSASPVFFQNLVAGAHYKTVTIEVPKAHGDPKGAGKPFLQYKFNTVFTTKIDWSGPGDDGPQESITFVYGGLRVKYEKQETIRPVGQTVPPVIPSQPISILVVTMVPPGSNPTSNPASGLTIPGCPPSGSTRPL